MYQPKTGKVCACRPGIERDNCPQCEGTGQCVDFRAIRERREGTITMPTCHRHPDTRLPCPHCD